MKKEFPHSLANSSELNNWISILAENAIASAKGQASDAEYTGDLADTMESRIESEVELEVDDKIDVLSSARTPYDVLRLTETSPSDGILQTLTTDKSTSELALQLAHDALVQEVREEVGEIVSDNISR